jgi:hypothetical protein
MTKLSIELKKRHVDFVDYSSVESIQEETRSVQEEAKQLTGCDGVYFYYELDPYESQTNMYWVFYRLETDEEEALREKRDKARSDAYKKQQYERLKKELGL